MRDFQKASLLEVDRALSSRGITLRWEERSLRPIAALDYGPGDVDLYASFTLGGRFEIWIGPHELCLKTPGMSVTVERQDYPDAPRARIERFIEILHQQMSRMV